jgi:hypothetical protein
MLLVFFLLLIGTALIVTPIVYMRVRKTFREQKNYERGLKMVPLKIHLPPPSDDTDASGRDVRDIIDENVSKAQILYSVVSSIFQKGMKNQFYGQRHISFEIIAATGAIEFYAVVPVKLVEVVMQAVVSAYPSARMEEVEEHNIFNRTGKIAGVVGGELTLKEHFAYPIATYQDLKRDPIQSMLNALSSLTKDEGVGVQILIRPASGDWRRQASEVAKNKRKGNKSLKGLDGAFWWLRQIFVAMWKPPDDKSGGGGSDKPDLSPMDQSILDSIDDKTRNPGFETLVRVVASSDVPQKSEAIISNLVAAFALFNAPGKNGFKYTPAKDKDAFVTSYLMRFFPQELNKSILNTVELATLFHFPDQRNIPTSQLERQQSKQVDGPRNMPEDGLLLGYNVFRNSKKPIRLALGDRQRHMYVVGQTGVGKSVFLENLALQDMINGDGFAFVDPHGDTAEKLLSMVPKERTEDVIYFCPSDMDYPMGLNLFEFYTPEQKDFLIQEALNMLYKLYDPQRQGIIGPRFERIFTNCALLLMAAPSGGTFVDVPKLLIDPAFMKEKLQYVKDQNVLDFWTKEWPNSQRSNEAGEVTSWVVSKFGAFLSNEMMRNIIGQTKSSFNLREIMDNKKILIVNLSKGRTGDLNSRLLGMIFVMKFQAAAMSRADVPESERPDFCLYVDEFQNFSTDSFATIMSEARKYHLNLIVANQFTTQLSEEIRDAVFGNMGTIVSFRIGQNDVDSMARYFQPLFGPDDLLRVPNYNTVVRTLVRGVPTQPFSMAALPPLGNPNPKLGTALKQLSFAKFGRPRKQVEKLIFARLATKEPAKPASGFGGGSQGAFGSAARPGGATAATGKPPAPSTGSSFLDDWLAKRKLPGPAAPAGAKPPQPTPAATPEPASPPVTPAVSASDAWKAGAPAPPTGTAAEPKASPAEGKDSQKASPDELVPAVPVTPVAGPPPDTEAKKANDTSEPNKAADTSAEKSVSEGVAEPATGKPREDVAVDKPEEKPEPKPKKDAGELKISARHGIQESYEDTIYIDKEGNLRQSDDIDMSLTAPDAS